MRSIFNIIPSILVATAVVAAAEDPFVSQPAGAEEPASDSTMSAVLANVEDIVTNRLEIGLRYSHFTLVDDKKNGFDANGNPQGFLGSINELEAKQSDIPYPFARFFPNPYVGIEIGYDKVSAITRKFTPPPPGGSRSRDSDGTLVLQGPLFEIVGRYPNETIVTPYAGFGPVFYGDMSLGDSNFEQSPWWHNGFGTYDDPDYVAWENEGRPAWPNGGYRRNIEVSDTMGWVLSGGMSVAVYKGLEIEASLQYVWADVDAHYYLSNHGYTFQDEGNYTFPMDHWSYQLGLKYAF